MTGLARSRIKRGQRDLDLGPLPKGRVRRTGGGRKAVTANDPGLVPELKCLVEPATLGDPERPLIWVSKSMDKLADALTAAGHRISADTVKKELVKLGFSRQFNRKADEGSNHPDRNAQFENNTAKVMAAQAAGHRRADRRREHEGGTENRVRARHADLRKRHQGQRRRNGHVEHHRR